MTIVDNITAVREKIAQSAERSGRLASEISLIGVTKTRSPAEILEAAPFLDAIGENRVQEAVRKKPDCPGTPEWRLIGHLQSNKARKALEIFDSIDSINSLRLAATLERIAAEQERVIPVLIGVNTAEDSKTGIPPEDFEELLESVLDCPHLSLQGLMTIAPFTQDESEVRRAFAFLRALTERARASSGLPLPELSMGMSGDFEWAILEGSTMVRLGSVIFGERIG